MRFAAILGAFLLVMTASPALPQDDAERAGLLARLEAAVVVKAAAQFLPEPGEGAARALLEANPGREVELRAILAERSACLNGQRPRLMDGLMSAARTLRTEDLREIVDFYESDKLDRVKVLLARLMESNRAPPELVAELDSLIGTPAMKAFMGAARANLLAEGSTLAADVEACQSRYDAALEKGGFRTGDEG